MPPNIYPPDYPPNLTDVQKDYLTTFIKDWSIAHGLAVRPSSAALGDTYTSSDGGLHLATTAPVTLFPSLFPLQCFHEALILQKAYNEVYSAVARDEAWLEKMVDELRDVDDFIAKLWNIHLKVKAEGYAQDLTLGLFRSDYMVHVDPEDPTQTPTIRQVEFNTISSSFGGLSSRVASLHRYLLLTATYPREAAAVIRPDLLPSNASIESLAAGLAKAHNAYGPSKSGGRLLCILFVVQDPERNVFDQRHIEYALYAAARIRTFRIPFSRVASDTTLDPATRALTYTPPAFPDRSYEVTTVYYRAGYSPDEYTSESVWDARLHLELSAAIKCPSILTHLAGSKKVQQILAAPDSPHLARFLPFPGIAARVRQTFAPIYPLDASPLGLQARRLAADPATAVHYVLKPQREGGGNNVYRGAIPGFLKSLPEEKWAAWILMEMIEPPAQRNYIFRNGAVLEEGGVICELGVYGACLWRHGDGGGGGGSEGEGEREGDAGEIISNEEAGWLLRTKGDASEEGGVAAGFGAVDSVCLVDV